ncbi:MAG: hypothetical protein U0797_16560 [Gemmataceae bacterium]
MPLTSAGSKATAPMDSEASRSVSGAQVIAAGLAGSALNVCQTPPLIAPTTRWALLWGSTATLWMPPATALFCGTAEPPWAVERGPCSTQSGTPVSVIAGSARSSSASSNNRANETGRRGRDGNMSMISGATRGDRGGVRRAGTKGRANP